jgi:hypothetical protein
LIALLDGAIDGVPPILSGQNLRRIMWERFFLAEIESTGR